MMRLIWADFGHDHTYYVNDYMRPNNPRRMKQKAQESLESQVDVDATFMFMR